MEQIFEWAQQDKRGLDVGVTTSPQKAEDEAKRPSGVLSVGSMGGLSPPKSPSICPPVRSGSPSPRISHDAVLGRSYGLLRYQFLRALVKRRWRPRGSRQRAHFLPYFSMSSHTA